MRSTVDTYTGKRFRWNETVRYRGLVVPCRLSTRDSIYLDPSRVPERLLRELNSDTEVDAYLASR